MVGEEAISTFAAVVVLFRPCLSGKQASKQASKLLAFPSASRKGVDVRYLVATTLVRTCFKVVCDRETRHGTKGRCYSRTCMAHLQLPCPHRSLFIEC